MAPPKAAPPIDQDAADAPAGVQSPPDAATVARLVAQLVRVVAPSATNIRIQYDVPQGKGVALAGVIPLPVSKPSLSELAADIMAVLDKLSPGQWLNGAALAAAIDPANPPDHTAGGWRRAVDELKAHEMIDTHPRKGYCRL